MVFLPALALVLTSLPSSAQAPDTTPAPSNATRPRVLLVSGANNHDWEWTTPSLERILAETGRFEVTVTRDPARSLADRAALAALDAVVLDYNGPRWGEAAETAFLDAVRGGLGVVVIHAADNHGNGWPEYERLVADLWRRGTGHGRFHPFDVEVVDRDHPVTRTLPTILQHPDELYHNLVNVHGVDRRVLATAFSSKESGGTGEAEPMILVRSYGEGRMFHTPLGHVWRNVPGSQASHRDPQFRGLIVRGTEWAATGTVTDARTAPAPATGEWRSLMDREQWGTLGGGDVPEGWRFEGDVLRREGAAGDIVTREAFGDFELTFQWKATVAGNSGVKYRIPEQATEAVGPEFQLLDPAAPTENPEHRAGALYDVIPAGASPSVPWGEFHEARIVSRGSTLEHWLDGALVASADTSSDEWTAAVADSKFRGRDGFAAAGPGRILIQDHGDEVWIRGMRIRELGGGDQLANPLFPSESTEGWSNVGDARYEVQGSTLIGRAGPQQQQSFLVSNREFGDYTMEVDVRIAVEGNSGIQIRSHVGKDGKLRGYQAEIDPSPRSWSAGLFDEGRRAWLDDLSDNKAAREAFDLDGWNRYRIVCEGPRVRTWINGVAAADLLDGEDLTGSIAFQIHGWDDDIEIHWRDPRVEDRGRHGWVPQDPKARCALGGAPGARATVLGEDVELRLVGADGAVLTRVDLSAREGWKADSMNRVTVLLAPDRAAIQLGDRTTLEVAVESVEALEFRSDSRSLEVRSLTLCERATD
ncbi:DUF1080 domain-containing protein [Planctomycetota bacterium]|nr:DUF1080 domain-containing protein [Planctomycetota bacterium]